MFTEHFTSRLHSYFIIKMIHWKLFIMESFKQSKTEWLHQLIANFVLPISPCFSFYYFEAVLRYHTVLSLGNSISNCYHIRTDNQLCVPTPSCTTLCDSVDCSPPSSSIHVHGISQARILEWFAISYSRGSSRTSDRTRVSHCSCIGRQSLYHRTTWEASIQISIQFLEVLQLAYYFLFEIKTQRKFIFSLNRQVSC